MRTFSAACLAIMFMASGAFAAADTSAPLIAGKPAGVKQAQLSGHGLLLVSGLAIVGGGIALAAAGNRSTPTTTTAATTGTP